MATRTVSQPAINGFWSTAALTVVGSLIANIIIYFIASALGAIPETVLVQPANLPITVAPVIMATLMGTVAGVLVFAALARFTRNPVGIFRILAVVVLIIAAVPSLILNAPISMVIALNIMHVVAGLIVVLSLSRTVR